MISGLPLTGTLVVPATELGWRFSRAGGPGGQKVNTSDTRVELRFDVAGSASLPPAVRDRILARLADRLVDGVLTVVASEHRSQLRNRQAALARMTALLRAAAAPAARRRRPTAPTRRAIEARLAAKRRQATRKQDRRPPRFDER